MRNAYLFLGMLILSMLSMACITSNPPSASHPPSTIDDLSTMELNPSGNYADQLMAVIEGDGEPYLKERAVFTLTRIALNQNETRAVIPLLKDLAMHASSEEIRTAAHANLNLITTIVPQPTYGYLNVSVEGDIRTGNPIRLVAEVSSTVPTADSIVGIRRLPQSMNLQSDPIVYLTLQPNEPQIVEFQIIPQDTGTYLVPVSLVLSLDQVESYERTVDVTITVRELEGNYSVREWETPSPEGEVASMTKRVPPP